METESNKTMSLIDLAIHGVRTLRIVRPTKLFRAASSDLIIETDKGDVCITLFSSADATDGGFAQVSSVQFTSNEQLEVTQ